MRRTSAPAQQVHDRKSGTGEGACRCTEMVAANDGIGFMIWNAWQVLTVDTMYVGLLIITVLGFIFSVILDEIERRLIPWKSSI